MIRRRKDNELVPADYWWSPYDVNTLGILDEMDRLFDDFRSGFNNSLMVPREGELRALRTPVVDLIDKGTEYVLKAEMPGMKKEDVSIEVGEKEVQISAETKEERNEDDKQGGYIRRERRYSRIFRKVPLPEAVQADKTTAEIKDGLLIINLPKVAAPERKSKRIDVK